MGRGCKADNWLATPEMGKLGTELVWSRSGWLKRRPTLWLLASGPAGAPLMGGTIPSEGCGSGEEWPGGLTGARDGWDMPWAMARYWWCRGCPGERAVPCACWIVRREPPSWGLAPFRH